MAGLIQFISGFLSSHKTEPPQNDKSDALTPDQVAYLREMADRERRSWVSNKNRA
jgi:hypothetical protein